MGNGNGKVKTPAELATIVQELKKKGKKVVLSHGAFDVIHYGHIFYLGEAKKLGDVHIVSVISDNFVRKGLDKPIFNEQIRTHSLSMLNTVDYVVLCDNIGPWDLIKQIKPTIYAKGDDSARQLKNPLSGVSRDKKTVESVGGSFILTRTIPVHSADILNSYTSSLPKETVSFIHSFQRKYNVSDIITAIEKLKRMKVLVIGETIIDEYRYVSPLGKPAKSHVVAAHYLNKEEFAGGAIACANHAAGVVGQVDVLTYLGEKNSKEKFIRSQLKKNARPIFFICPNQPTIIKRRFVDHSYYSKFFEEYEFDKNYLPKNIEKKVESFLNKNLKKYDLVLVVDYGHGFLSDKLIKLISSKSKFLAVNTQTNSGNAGFNYITKYPRADYVCIDEMEARLATQNESGEIRNILSDLSGKLHTNKMIITMAKKGVIGMNKKYYTETPSFVTKITDTVGAGDAFLAISAPCAAAGMPIDLTAFVGSVASAIAVDIIGNKSSVEREELFRRMGYLLD